MTKKFKIAICGAGIGGLALAVSLMQYPDIDVEIFEGASRIGEVGAGIAIWPRVWKILQKLGLDEELLKHTNQKVTDEDVPGLMYRKSDEPVGRDLFRMHSPGGVIQFHRADFQSVLLQKINTQYPLHTSKRLQSYHQPQSTSGPIVLTFEDGTTATCDILVGADGLHSSVRRSLLTEIAQSYRNEGKEEEAKDALDGIEPVWSGTNAYRAVVPAEVLAKEYPEHRALTTQLHYIGKGYHIISYPIQHGKIINLVFFRARHELENTKLSRPMSMTCKNTDIVPLFDNWEPEVKALIACAGTLGDWAIHTVRPLKSFVSGRACLLGDAAHAMTPFQASGAGQAIEDALILSTILGNSNITLPNVHTALEVYDEIRRPFALDIQERSRQNGQQASLWREDDLENLERNHCGSLEWAWRTTIDSMVKDGVGLLEEKLA